MVLTYNPYTKGFYTKKTTFLKPKLKINVEIHYKQKNQVLQSQNQEKLNYRLTDFEVKIEWVSAFTLF